jgi:hypothetical protein
MVAMMGVWSEVGRWPEVSVVDGYSSPNPVQMKARSSLAKVGDARLLVQVKRRSRRGSSKSCNASTVWLKREAREKLKLALFLSEGERVRLKSLIRSHGAEIDDATPVRSVRN